MTTTKIAPDSRSSIYKAAVYIETHGPQTVRGLLAAVDFGWKSDQQEKLNHAFEINWLQQTPSGWIGLTESSRKHFDSLGPKEEYVGKIAPPAYRPNVFATTLSPRFRTNSRGPRQDVPEWSLRPEGFGMKSAGGGKA